MLARTMARFTSLILQALKTWANLVLQESSLKHICIHRRSISTPREAIGIQRAINIFPNCKKSGFMIGNIEYRLYRIMYENTCGNVLATAQPLLVVTVLYCWKLYVEILLISLISQAIFRLRSSYSVAKAP